MSPKTTTKKQSSILDSFCKKDVNIEVKQTCTLNMVTDIVIQEISESTESDMNEVCDLMIDENPFFDTDMNGLIDGDIYTGGGRKICIIESTKYGLNSFLTPIESDKKQKYKNLDLLES